MRYLFSLLFLLAYGSTVAQQPPMLPRDAAIEAKIEKLLEQLENLQGKCEIILVDGGSTDATLSMIRPGFKVLHSEKGRANQMNLGAKESTGDILFFLHSIPLSSIIGSDREHGLFADI